MRVVAGFFCLLFFFAAALQWNDPDPLRWVLVYGLASVLSGAAAMGRSWPFANAAASMLFAVGFLILAPSLMHAESAAFESFQMREVRHEEPREAIGLALAASWCGFMAWTEFSRR